MFKKVLYLPRNIGKLDTPDGTRIQLHLLTDLYSEIKIESCRLVRQIPDLAAIPCISDTYSQRENNYLDVSKTTI
jgi:hypothetical protein